MVIIGRSYMSIALGSEQVNHHFPEEFFYTWYNITIVGVF